MKRNIFVTHMVLIRADANETIGTGHVMRCLSIAKAFRTHGAEVLFITADHKSDQLISNAGFSSACLDGNWSDLPEELPKLTGILEELRPELLLVDSYYVTDEYLKKLRRHAPVAYIDDVNKQTWDVDWLVNYNIYAESYDYGGYAGTRTGLLLSPRFAPLREEFRDPGTHAINSTVSNVLVSAGGSDPERITERMISEICPEWPDIRFHFVVGGLNPRISKIRALESGNVVLHIDEKHMSSLMKAADVAISAAGSTLYELCACGTPTITYTLADNQLDAAKAFERQGIMVYAGDCRENDRFINDLEESFRDLINDVSRRTSCSEKMQALVDGSGAERIAEAMLQQTTGRY